MQKIGRIVVPNTLYGYYCDSYWLHSHNQHACDYILLVLHLSPSRWCFWFLVRNKFSCSQTAKAPCILPLSCSEITWWTPDGNVCSSRQLWSRSFYVLILTSSVPLLMVFTVLMLCFNSLVKKIYCCLLYHTETVVMFIQSPGMVKHI